MKEESQGYVRIIAQNCVVTGGRLMKGLMDIQYFFFCTTMFGFVILPRRQWNFLIEF